VSAAFSLLVVGFAIEGYRSRANPTQPLDRAHVEIHRVGTSDRAFLTCEEAAALSAALTCAVKAARGES
jgi:hypothetical protein